MRKITGYIGALVIVISLMCTILAGYALNVDKANVTVDKYDYVTDVSGLFEYSDEKQYIDYSPATNYTGYGLNPVNATFTKNNVGSYNIFMMNDGGSYSGSISYSNGYLDISVNNATKYNGALSSYIHVCGWSNSHIEINAGRLYSSLTGFSSTIAFNYNNNSLTVSYFNSSNSWVSTTITTDFFFTLSQSNENYCSKGFYGYNTTYYLNNINQIYCAFIGSQILYTHGNTGYLTNSTTSQTINIPTSTITDYSGGITVNNINSYHPISGYNLFYVICPKSVDITYSGSDDGISYTSTTQLNNYKMNTSTTTSASTTLTLTGSYIQATDVLTNPAYIRLYGVSGSDYVHLKNPYIVKFSDMVTSLNLSSSVTTVEFTNTGYSSYTNNNFDTEVSTNQVLFVTPSDFRTSNYDHDNNIEYVMSCAYNTVNYKAVYNAANGIVNIYYNDVWQSTGAASSTYIVYGGTPVKINVNSSTLSETSYTLSPSPTSYLTYKTYQETTYYMNISKGVSVNNSNSNYYTKWSNGYENSIIDILFRAENSAASYSNTISVGSDTITVTYANGGYTAKINNGTATNIGDWRSIVLSIDALNKTVTAYPVKTFTTYVDVDLYDTPIVISGSLTTTGAVASLTFAAASSPLMMSIYNTHVFMDTYGAVMVDPSLDVNDYFNLNGFYRLNLYSFALSGDKITINGTDYTVTDNKITVNNAAHTLQNINITWRNGHTYLTFVNDNITVDLGSTTSTVLSMTGAWYFTTGLYSGYTTSELKYEWNWSNFIFNNGQFVVFFLGFGAAAFLVSKHFCSYSMMDYVLLILAVICAITVTVI